MQINAIFSLKIKGGIIMGIDIKTIFDIGLDDESETKNTETNGN